MSVITTRFPKIAPVITILIAAKLPAGLPLYWTVTTIFGVGEYLLVQHKNEKSKNNSQNN